MVCGAGERSRTSGLLITNQLLYQLSYTSVPGFASHAARSFYLALEAGAHREVPLIRVMFSWPRLSVAVALSILFHVVLAFGLLPKQRSAERYSDTVPFLTARIVPQPDVASATRWSAPFDHKTSTAAGAKQPKAPARGRVAAPESNSPVRHPSYSVLAAYAELEEPLETEKLTELQRRVPRANTLAKPAEPLDSISPVYPAAALARGFKGQVLVEAFIGPSGFVYDAIVLDDGGKPDLGRAAVQAVRRTRFRPSEGTAGVNSSRVTLRIGFSYE